MSRYTREIHTHAGELRAIADSLSDQGAWLVYLMGSLRTLANVHAEDRDEIGVMARNVLNLLGPDADGVKVAPAGYALVPLDPPESLRGQMCGYGADLGHMAPRDRAVILQRGAERWAEILRWAGADGVKVAPAPMQGLADWLRANAAALASSDESRACIEQWAREVEDARGVSGGQHQTFARKDTDGSS